MFAAVNLEPPHQLGFKCTPEAFAELTEREGIVPAPYLARAMWVQESELGAALERQELAPLLRSAYDLVVAKLPTSRRPAAKPAASKLPARKRKTHRRDRRRHVTAVAGQHVGRRRRERARHGSAKRRSRGADRSSDRPRSVLRVCVTSTAPAGAPSSTRRLDPSAAALRRARADEWRSGRGGSGCASRIGSAPRSL